MHSLIFCFASKLFITLKWVMPLFGHQLSFVKNIDLSKFIYQDTSIHELKIPLWHISFIIIINNNIFFVGSMLASADSLILNHFKFLPKSRKQVREKLYPNI
jgi:hypothetical protein